MKLNNDCVRSILMLLEERSMPSTFISFSEVEDQLKDDFSEEIVYGHILLLEDAGFIKIVSKYIDGDGLIEALTWDGQQYIKNIRDEEVWNTLKNNIGNCSLDVVASLAKDVAMGIAKKKLKNLGIIGD